MVRPYKSKYLLAFYEDDDDTLFSVFTNVQEVYERKKQDSPHIQKEDVMLSINRALRKNKTGKIYLFGRPMIVYLIDIEDELEQDKEEY